MPDYTSEFSLEGETSEKIGTWTYRTYDDHIIDVDVYKYCDINMECILVAFDVSGNKPLSTYDITSFFANYAISSIIFSDAAYQSPYSSSEVCSALIPDFRAELSSLTVKAAEQGSAYISPQEAKYLKLGIRAARTLGYVGEFNIAVFGFSAVCLGSSLFENSVANELTKCHVLLQESKNRYVSYLRPTELIECNNTLAKQLEDSRFSPNVLFKNVETFFRNLLSPLNCGGSREPCPQPQRYVTDIIDEMIPAVKGVSNQISTAIVYAPQDASISDGRIIQKMNEASAAIIAFDIEYNNMTAQLANHQWTNMVFDQFKTPTYDLAAVERAAAPAVQKHNEAYANLNAYKFNSVVKSSQEGLSHTIQALAVLEEHESIHREYNIGLITLVFGVPIVGFVLFIFLRHRFYR